MIVLIYRVNQNVLIYPYVHLLVGTLILYIINKLDELHSRISLRHPDIICVTEVFPKHCFCDITVVELCIGGYDCFYSTFSHDIRGVVCIYVKSKYKAHKVETIKIPFQQVIWCSIPFKDTDSLLLGVGFYRSPMSSEANDAMQFDEASCVS